jgi:hypothetical protein
MKTLAALLFVAAIAAVAIHLARRPTIADGRVMETDLLAQLREQGVTGMQCDRQIPIRRDGATFACLATLDNGTQEHLIYQMDRTGQLKPTVEGDVPTRKVVPPKDPWAN